MWLWLWSSGKPQRHSDTAVVMDTFGSESGGRSIDDENSKSPTHARPRGENRDRRRKRLHDADADAPAPSGRPNKWPPAALGRPPPPQIRRPIIYRWSSSCVGPLPIDPLPPKARCMVRRGCHYNIPLRKKGFWFSFSKSIATELPEMTRPRFTRSVLDDFSLGQTALLVIE